MKYLSSLARFSIAILTIIILFANTSYSQNKSTLRISILDQNKGVITSGTAKIKSKKSKLEKTTAINQTGVAMFGSLPSGEYILEVISAGFELFEQNIVLKSGRNIITVDLRIKQIKVEIKVERDKQEKRKDESFNETLTKEEIRALPDDVETELKRKYGDDILIQVDGFTGGRLPPKEQIASIKIIKNSFDAEFHEVGRIIVKITTKAGIGRWVGTGSFNFGDSRLNARNPFADARLPKQERSFFGFLSGPIIKNKTSLNLFLFGNNNIEKKNIIAIVPGREIENDLKTKFSMFSSRVGIKHNLTKTHGIKLQYEFNRSNSENIGVGEFSLPENGYSSNSKSHRFRFGSDGIIAKKYVNEFRAQLHFSTEESKPNSTAREIIVSDAFNSGGAGVDNSADSKKLTVSNNLIFDHGKHALKFGVYFDFESYRGFSDDNTNGTFIFTNLFRHQFGRPSIFRQRQGTSKITVNQTQMAFYFQDDIRFYKNFQIGVGLRYERQGNLNDSNNFSPRVSFTYSPFKNGKIVFRGGAGVFYEWLAVRDLEQIYSNDGRQASELIIRFPGFPNPLDSGFVSASLPPSVLRKDENLKNPYVFVAQGAFNYRVLKKFTLEGSYTFQKGVSQFRSRDLNAPIERLRPNPLFGRIAQVESSGNLIRHSLKLSTQGRLPKGIIFNTRYELAKSKDDYDGVFGLPVNNNDLRAEFGASSLDRRHFLTGSFSIPLLQSVRLTPTFQIGSPYPYTITTGFDNNRDTVFNDRPVGVRRNGERGVWSNQVDLRIGWDIPMFKSKSRETADKNKNVLNLVKRRAIGFDITIQNVFNRANLEGFVGNQLSPFFGQPTYASQSRSIKFGFRFLFF